MESQIQSIVTILSLMNPAICAAMFMDLTQGQSKIDKYRNSFKAMFTISIILISSALFGTQVLRSFGISFDAFSVAGGFVLVWMGFSMMKNSSSDSSSKIQKGSLSPLVMFAASPGTITGVITLAVSHRNAKLPITALIAVAIALLITWLVLLLSIKFSSGSKATKSQTKQTLTSFMGLIVLSMGFQFALSGIKNFF